MACFPDITITIVDLELFLYYYPLGSGLNKLYIGLGSGCGFIMYSDNADIQDDTTISISPLLGWKWRALKSLMIEPFIGWKFYIFRTNNYENIMNYLNGDFQWGIKFKIFLPK
jgi:hypothetical protein